MKKTISNYELDIEVSEPMTEFDNEMLEQLEAYMGDEAFTSIEHIVGEPLYHSLFPVMIQNEEIDITFYTTKLN